MSLIKNLIKEPENKSQLKKKKATADGEELEDEKKPRPFIKSATDLQRLKLEKLMKNPDKPVNIPEAPRDRDHMQTVPSFVRNVMGSSAGAGSGEFHVYRHLRRKEYARQKTIQAKSIKEQLDDNYQQKLENNRRLAEEKTAKKRAKRLKKKQRGGKKTKGAKNVETTFDVDQNEENTTDEEEAEAEVVELQGQTSAEQPDNEREEIITVQSKEDNDSDNKNDKTQELNSSDEEEAEAEVVELQGQTSAEQPDNVRQEIITVQSKEDNDSDNKNDKTQELDVCETKILEHKGDALIKILESENRTESLKSENKEDEKSIDK